jgi:limonene-1,2-epoxide hydrolase
MALDEHRITSVSQLCDLWKGVYRGKEGVDWSGLLPYYDEDILFKDSIQEIRGITEFAAMTERLAKRSRDLQYVIHSATMEGDLVFVEWEMVISYKKFPTASLYGASRITLREGKIIEQRDYYDLWGDIIDNIPFLNKGYRRFMKKRFG